MVGRKSLFIEKHWESYSQFATRRHRKHLGYCAELFDQFLDHQGQESWSDGSKAARDLIMKRRFRKSMTLNIDESITIKYLKGDSANYGLELTVSLYLYYSSF